MIYIIIAVVIVVVWVLMPDQEYKENPRYRGKKG